MKFFKRQEGLSNDILKILNHALMTAVETVLSMLVILAFLFVLGISNSFEQVPSLVLRTFFIALSASISIELIKEAFLPSIAIILLFGMVATSIAIVVLS